MVDTTGARLLMVDDEKSTRDTLGHVLIDAGYHVDTVESASEALSALDPKNPYAVVITDLQMPQMD